MCGDTSTHKEFPCLCGSSSLTYWHTQHYCCLPPGERCSDGNRKTVCRSGEAVHKSEPCHGVCNEDSEASVEGSCGYTDQCRYNNVEFMCGAICTHRPCTCAGTQLKHYSSEYCCTLQEDLCSFENGNLRYPTCTNGTVISKSDSCNGRCYNSYQHSSKLGRDAHYSCPDGRCLPVKDVRRKLQERCRGVDVGVCSHTMYRGV